MMYQYIFFDLDGTLTDSSEGIKNCVRYTVEKLGGQVPPEELLVKFIGPPLQDSFMKYCGYDAELAIRAVDVFRERYAPIGQYENAAVPGAAEMMARLKERGYKLALASSKPHEMCLSICDRFGFAPSLAAISGSPIGGDATKAEVIRGAMRDLGLTDADTGSILMVGDRHFDVEGARECGIDCIGVEFFGYADPGELEKAGAIAVVKTVEDLEAFILNH